MNKPNKSQWCEGLSSPVVVEPSAEKKATGWDVDERPPREYFNWLFQNNDLWNKYNAGQAMFSVIIGGNEEERDYETLADYLAATPASGDFVHIRDNQLVSSKIIIPAGINIFLNPTRAIICNTAVSGVVEFSDNVKVIERLNILCGHTGTVDNVLLLNGNNIDAQDIRITQTGSGTITNAIYLGNNKDNNNIIATVESGSGTITNALNDDDNLSTNNIIMVNGE